MVAVPTQMLVPPALNMLVGALALAITVMVMVPHEEVPLHPLAKTSYRCEPAELELYVLWFAAQSINPNAIGGLFLHPKSKKNGDVQLYLLPSEREPFTVSVVVCPVQMVVPKDEVILVTTSPPPVVKE